MSSWCFLLKSQGAAEAAPWSLRLSMMLTDYPGVTTIGAIAVKLTKVPAPVPDIDALAAIPRAPVAPPKVIVPVFVTAPARLSEVWLMLGAVTVPMDPLWMPATEKDDVAALALIEAEPASPVKPPVRTMLPLFEIADGAATAPFVTV